MRRIAVSTVLLLLIALSDVLLAASIASPTNELARLQTLYTSAVARIDVKYLALRTNAVTQYFQGLDLLEKAYQQKGEFKSVIAVRGEQQQSNRALPVPDPDSDFRRFIGLREEPQQIDSQMPVPGPDSETDPMELKNVKARMRVFPARLAAEKTKEMSALVAAYLFRLEALQRELKKQGQIDLAAEVQVEMDEIKALPVAEAQVAQSATSTTADMDKPQTHDPVREGPGPRSVAPSDPAIPGPRGRQANVLQPASGPIANGIVIVSARDTLKANQGSQGKKSPLEGVLVVVYNAGWRLALTNGTTGQDGKVQLDVNPEPKYDLVAFCKGYEFLIKKDVRLSLPLDLTLAPLPAGQSIDLVTRSGLSLFDETAKDIQLGTAYRHGPGRTSYDIRCMSDECLIGHDKPTLTTIEKCAPGQSFSVKKGERQVKCDVLWFLPRGFLIQYRVSPQPKMIGSAQRGPSH